ncbi:hypothetical protein MHY20_07430 [Helcobacillus sp. ACRRO]|uniref:hypothetical protein n=1 Tax=Helcobacillus sp. ACRRO TaxID=2918202 RepID=UPI001EF43CE1|nr:hypothetical protein [Helcobacillus sp. ACRRO]MCG7427439.1 hypothetical protein [Helcobacillus sp. ACRRO]
MSYRLVNPKTGESMPIDAYCVVVNEDDLSSADHDAIREDWTSEGALAVLRKKGSQFFRSEPGMPGRLKPGQASRLVEVMEDRVEADRERLCSLTDLDEGSAYEDVVDQLIDDDVLLDHLRDLAAGGAATEGSLISAAEAFRNYVKLRPVSADGEDGHMPFSAVSRRLRDHLVLLPDEEITKLLAATMTDALRAEWALLCGRVVEEEASRFYGR